MSTAEPSFFGTIRREARLVDLSLLAVVPLVLVSVFALPEATREALVFRVTEPTATTAYTAHFVHTSDWHLLGNVGIYLGVVPAVYLCCLLSGRRQLFRWTFLTVLAVFPFVLSGMQLAFPDDRLVFGFSGINAAFFGVLCFTLVSYVGRTLSRRVDERDAPALLFVLTALIAFVLLPDRAWRLELVSLSVGLGLVYVLVELATDGLPTRAELRDAVNRPGYVEFAGGGFGLVFAYPFVGFQTGLSNGATLDVYVHVLGLCFGFLVVYVSVMILNEYADAWDAPAANSRPKPRTGPGGRADRDRRQTERGETSREPGRGWNRSDRGIESD